MSKAIFILLVILFFGGLYALVLKVGRDNDRLDEERAKREGREPPSW